MRSYLRARAGVVAARLRDFGVQVDDAAFDRPSGQPYMKS
jgi:hypothetical protein